MTKVRITPGLRSFTGGEKEVEFTPEPPTIGGVLGGLEDRFEGITERILDEVDGEPKISKFFNIFRNDEDVRYLGGLATEVLVEHDVAILIAVAGGSV